MGDPVACDFGTPQHVKQALMKAVEEGANAYSPSEGLPELRQAISLKEKRVNGVDVSADDIIATAGISEGIQMVMAALIDSGDEIITFIDVDENSNLSELNCGIAEFRFFAGVDK